MAWEAKTIAAVVVGVFFIVIVGSVALSLWADSSGYAGIGISIASAISSPFIAFFQGLANIITHYLNPVNWLILTYAPTGA